MSNSCCINLGHTGPDGVQVTIIRLQYLSNSKTTSNSCCINLGLTEPDGVQVTIISYDIYQTLKTTSNSCFINLGHTGPDGEQVTKEKRTPTFNEVIRLGIGLHCTTM